MDSFGDIQDRSALATVNDASISVKVGSNFNKVANLMEGAPGKQAECLSVEEIKKFAAYLKDQRSSVNAIKRLSLLDILKGSEVQLPKLEIPERSKELEERVQKLRASLANKEYKKMTENVSFTGSRYLPEESLGAELKQMNAGMLAVLQFVITVLAAFAFGFIGVELFMGQQLELAVKLLLGIILGLIVAVAEFYFLLKNIDLQEKKSVDEKAKKTS